MNRTGSYNHALMFLIVALLPAATAHAETIGYSWSSGVYGGDRILYEIVLETGQATPLGFIPGLDLDGGAALPDGRIVGIDGYNAEYWEMNPNVALLGSPSMAGVDHGMHYDVTTDTLYALSGGTWADFECSYLYTVDPDTGATTLIGHDPAHYAASLAISPTGEAFALDLTWHNWLYSVDLETGQLSFVTDVHTASGQTIIGGGGMAFAPDGTLWMTRPTYGQIFRLNPSTGILSYVSTISVHQPGYRWYFLAIPLAAQPACDPASLCAQADLNVDCAVDAEDLAMLMGTWGPCPEPCPPGMADFNDDCVVDGHDLATLLSVWGECP